GRRGAGLGMWLIIERDAAAVVGDAGFKGSPADGRVEIGYSIIPSRRRRGYATEAAQALIGWALEHEDIDTVVAACATTNMASIRTLEPLGVTRTGGQDDQIQRQLWLRRPREKRNANPA